MFLIVGLGNPGDEYENTRHNVGFDIIDLLSKEYNIDINRIKFKGKYGKGNIEGQEVILLKPLTYMNLSGESVVQVVNFYKIPKDNIIIIYDDIDLEIGRLRLRTKGSDGGHNGVKNIILNLSSDQFIRVRIGIGQSGNSDDNLISYVLGKFGKEDRQKIEEVFKIAIQAIKVTIKYGAQEAMNKFNGFKLET